MEELGTSGISLQVQKGFLSPVITHATIAKQEREDRRVLNWVIAVEVGNCGQILDILEGRTNRIHYHLGLSVREKEKPSYAIASLSAMIVYPGEHGAQLIKGICMHRVKV